MTRNPPHHHNPVHQNPSSVPPPVPNTSKCQISLIPIHPITLAAKKNTCTLYQIIPPHPQCPTPTNPPIPQKTKMTRTPNSPPSNQATSHRPLHPHPIPTNTPSPNQPWMTSPP